jgi:hypothetical protein
MKSMPTEDQEVMLAEALAEWMFDTIFEIGNVDEETNPGEVLDCVVDFVFPKTDEEELASVIWMLKEYDLAITGNTSENRWDYALISNETSRRFVGIISDESHDPEAAGPIP